MLPYNDITDYGLRSLYFEKEFTIHFMENVHKSEKKGIQ